MSDDAVTGSHVDALRASVDNLYVVVGEETSARVAETEARIAETAALERKQLTAAAALEASQKANRRSARTLAGAIVIGFLIVALGLLAQWGQSQSLRHEVDRREAERVAREAERVAGAVRTCENANVTRTRIVGYIDDRFGRLLTLAAGAGSPNATPEEEAQRQAALGELRAEFFSDPLPDEFKPRDCSPQAATTPAPLPSTTTTTTTLAPGP